MKKVIGKFINHYSNKANLEAQKQIQNAFLLILFIAINILIQACDEPNNLGLNFIDGSVIETKDTNFDINASVIRLDSINTTNTSALFFGRQADPVFGTTQAILYSNLFASNLTFPDTTNTYIYDSLVLVITITDFYGDTLLPQNFNIYTLNDTLTNGNQYYSDEKITDLSAQPIAGFTFDASTNDNNSIRVNLENDLGNLLFSELSDILEQSELEDIVSGISIQAENEETNLILEVLNNAFIGIYYHREDIDTIALASSIILGQRFMNIESDFTNTPLSLLETQDEIPMENLNGIGYLRVGLGIGLKITFPEFQNLGQNSKIQINESNLKLNIADNNNFSISPPEFFYIGYADPNQTNQIAINDNNLDSLLRQFTSAFPSTLIYNTNSRLYLSVSIFNYIHEIASKRRPDNGLIIFPSYFSFAPLSGFSTQQSLNQVQIDLSTSKLEIFYTTFSNE